MTVDEIREYYTTAYHGEAVEAGDFHRLFSRAEENLQMLTGWKLYSVSDQWLENVKKALCAQIEYLYLNGVESATIGTSGGSFTTGHVSVSSGHSSGSGGSSESSDFGICQRAQMLLFPTGLLYRGVILC